MSNSSLPAALHARDLHRIIATTHGCECRHVSTASVVERRDRQIIWNGEVLRFELKGHPRAVEAFAWAWDENGITRYITVLSLPPVSSPRDAVRYALENGLQPIACSV